MFNKIYMYNANIQRTTSPHAVNCTVWTKCDIRFIGTEWNLNRIWSECKLGFILKNSSVLTRSQCINAHISYIYKIFCLFNPQLDLGAFDKIYITNVWHQFSKRFLLSTLIQVDDFLCLVQCSCVDESFTVNISGFEVNVNIRWLTPWPSTVIESEGLNYDE